MAGVDPSTGDNRAHPELKESFQRLQSEGEDRRPVEATMEHGALRCAMSAAGRPDYEGACTSAGRCTGHIPGAIEGQVREDWPCACVGGGDQGGRLARLRLPQPQLDPANLIDSSQ